MSAPNRNLAWAEALLGELALCGVGDVIVSPGSRSAPLALAASAHPELRDRSILDERSAAFFALGLARARRSPVALVCTSGTAAANYLPAVVEAWYGRVPLLLVTADRPPELRDRGAGQTIDQVHLYGAYTRFFCELPPPAIDETSLRHVRASAGRAVAEASGPPAGPVHLNVPLREPLDPSDRPAERRALAELSTLARAGRAPEPLVRASTGSRVLDPLDTVRLSEALLGEEHGWLVCGPLDCGPELTTALFELSRLSGWPLFGEPLAQLRSGPGDRGLYVDAHDAVLRAEGFVREHLPRRVLRFGDMPTSKSYRLWLEAHPEIEQIVVDPDAWSDPTGLASQLVRADPTCVARALAHELRRRDRAPARGYASAWVSAGQTARRVLDRELLEQAALSEPGVVRTLASCLPDPATLFVASSMPVRDVDSFWPAASRRLRVVANRGANGIDGTLSTALGTAAGCGTPCAALVGDLALLHDWSGVLVARSSELDATIVVVDNDGGGIFEFLPIASSAPRAIFERHLATPHGVDLCSALAGFGLECTQAREPGALRDSIRDSLGRPGVQFVLVRSDRRANAELHRKLYEQVAAALTSDRTGS